MQNSVHYKSGQKNDVALVFSCPGQEEESANPQQPAIGQTGNNLKSLFEILKDEHELSGFTRDEVVITNAWDQVEYSTKTDRTEATMQELLTHTNLDRLAMEISTIKKIIICCGNNAIATVMALSYAEKIEPNANIITLPHLGNQALNSSIKTAIDGTEIISYSKAENKPANENRSLEKIRNDNRFLRLQVIARRFVEQLSKCKEKQ